jgi:hypothetical protein
MEGRWALVWESQKESQLALDWESLWAPESESQME